MKFFTAIIGIALLILPLPVAAGSPLECSKRVQSDLEQIHDIYRSYLFGSRKVTDDDGNEKYEVLTGGYTSSARRGIFETQRRLTSELITPAIESYRVYRCESLTVCSLLAASFATDGGTIDVQPLGCARRSLERYSECYLTSDDGSPALQSDATSLVKECQDLLERTFQSEKSVLRLAVAYDAGYRSMLQMAGMMDWLLEAFPTAALKAISEMVNMLGKLHQIPCFIGQCDNPRSDYLTPPTTP